MTRQAFEATLRDGTRVVLAEITPSEMLLALKLAGGDPSELVASSKAVRTALRFSVREVGTVAVRRDDLEARWGEYFPRTRHASELAEIWGRIHMPSEAETEAMRESMACETSADELWTVRLPGGRVVVMAEVPSQTVDDAMRAASQSSKSAQVQAFAATIEAARRSIRRIDGAPVSAQDLAGARWDERFSVKETTLLGVAFNEIHGTSGGPAAMGELRPVSSTP